MSYINVIVGHAAGLGPANTSIVGTEIISDSTSITLWPDERSAEIILQHGYRPGPIRISRQHISRVIRRVLAPPSYFKVPGSAVLRDRQYYAPDGTPRALVAAGCAWAALVYEDWASTVPVNPEDGARLLRQFMDEAGVTAATALEEVGRWTRLMTEMGIQRGMLCEGDHATGTVVAVGLDGGVKVVWPGANTADSYTAAQLAVHDFTFRWPEQDTPAS